MDYTPFRFFRNFIFSLTLLVFANECLAQRINFKSDNMSSEMPGIINLLGNAVLKQNNVTMYCDRAIFNENDNSFESFGKIKIVQGTSVTTGESLKYDGNTRTGKLRNNVRLIDGSLVLTTQFLDFNTADNTGYFYNGGQVVDSNATLVSRTGHYQSLTKTYFFNDKVVLYNDKYTLRTDTLKYNALTKVAYVYGPATVTGDSTYMYFENGVYNTQKQIASLSIKAYIKRNGQTIKGDSLYYNKQEKMGRAFRNVEMTDSAQKIIIRGEYAEYYGEPQRGFVTKKALLISIGDKDSLFLHADTLQSAYDSTGKFKVLKAYHKVGIYKPDIQARCDSLVYTTRDSVLHFYHNPILWNYENQITAEYIEVLTKNRKPDLFKLKTQSFIVSKHDTSAQYDQISGRNMIGYLKDNQLTKIDVLGNGETIYYPVDKKEIIGVNKAECSNLKIYIDEKKVQRVVFLSKPIGALHPLKELDAKDLILKNFKWLDKIRPMKVDDIFISKP